MTNDQTTTVAELKAAISEFAADRDWQQYHDPKNLVMALTSEVGVLADLFRWISNGQSLAAANDPSNAKEVAHELADVLMFALEFASVCQIDIASAIAEKLEINAQRYPVSKAKGSHLKYDRL